MTDNTLQEIKDRLNIAEVIGSYISLKKAGVNFKAICPFHGEKTASLIISPQKQIWHCFGCGEGGDVFGFVTRYENLEFKDVLKLLADKAGVKLPEYRPRDPKLDDEKAKLLRINDFAARFYHHILVNEKSGAAAMEYLKKRGLTIATIKQWQIGFAPEEFHLLEKALLKKDVQLNDMVKAGVSAKNEKGQIYDRFRGRVTFPIFNYMGEVVGFSARILADKAEAAKYVNSPETLIYNKSQVIFGLNFAKDAMRKKDDAVLVEGQMDCITAHQAGFNNVVATSGTALTSWQLSTLSRLTKSLKFCFDADAAGQAAARRAGALALKQGFKLKIVLLKAAKDPDELIRKSPGLWEKAVSAAEWFLDYQIDLAERNFPQDVVAQKHYLSTEVVPLLAFVQDPLEQDHYVLKMVERFGISERVIREQIKKTLSGITAPGSEPAAVEPGSQTYILEKEILGGAIKFEEFSEKVKAEVRITDFQNAEIREILGPVLGGQASLASSESPVAKEGLFMVELQLEEAGGNERVVLKNLEKSLAQLKLQSLKNTLQDLNLKIKLAEQSRKAQDVKALQAQFAEMSALRVKYESQI